MHAKTLLFINCQILFDSGALYSAFLCCLSSAVLLIFKKKLFKNIPSPGCLARWLICSERELTLKLRSLSRAYTWKVKKTDILFVLIIKNKFLVTIYCTRNISVY